MRSKDQIRQPMAAQHAVRGGEPRTGILHLFSLSCSTFTSCSTGQSLTSDPEEVLPTFWRGGGVEGSAGWSFINVGVAL